MTVSVSGMVELTTTVLPAARPAPANILVVDDHRIILTALSKSLCSQFRHCNILTAGTGAEALSLVETHHVDIVVTDIGMPLMDGFELIGYLRRNHPSLPVFVMTADLTPPVIERLRSMGVSYYVEKPFSLKGLGLRIARELKMLTYLRPFEAATQA